MKEVEKSQPPQWCDIDSRQHTGQYVNVLQLKEIVIPGQ